VSEQPGRRRGGDEVAFAPFNPSGHQQLRRPDVSPQVDVDGLIPFILGDVQAGHAGDARIREIQVDGPELVFCQRDQLLDVLGVGDIAGGSDGRAGPVGVDSACHGFGSLRIDIGDNDSGILVRQLGGQRRADTVTAAGDDSDFVGNFHRHILFVAAEITDCRSAAGLGSTYRS
jgi:hypothetical protein